MNVVTPVITYLSELGTAGDIFPGGLWDRPVTKEGEAATSEAFDDFGAIRPCASFTSTVRSAIGGPRNAAAGVLTCWVRSPDTVDGRTGLVVARLWLVAALRSTVLAVTDGSGILFESAEVALDAVPDPVNNDAVLSTVRVSFAGVWGV